MKNLKTKSLGNLRLLCAAQSRDEADINEALSVVDGFVSQSTQVELARELVLIYPVDSELWIGREIAGYPSQLPEGVHMKDFEAVEVQEGLLEEPARTLGDMLKAAEAESAALGGRLLRLQLDLENFDQPFLHVVKD